MVGLVSPISDSTDSLIWCSMLGVIEIVMLSIPGKTVN